MNQIMIVNEKTMKEILDIGNVIEVVKEAYQLKASQQADLFPIITHVFEPGIADMDIKSGHIKGKQNVFGLKLVSWFSHNKQIGLPEVTGTVMLFDGKTGAPKGILAAEYMTGMRTGAAGAIGSEYLARKDSRTLLLIGAGHQAYFQLAAHLLVLENIDQVMVYDPIKPESAIHFCKEIKEKLIENILSAYQSNKQVYQKMLKKFNRVEFLPVKDIAGSANKADIIVTATPSNKPLIHSEWIAKGTHITCIGADMEGKQEIDENIFTQAKVFVDDIYQAIHYGEAEMPYKKGLLKKEDIMAEIGEVILGKKSGRTSKEEITIFDSTGIALQDLMTAALALEKAKEKNIGMIGEV